MDEKILLIEDGEALRMTLMPSDRGRVRRGCAADGGGGLRKAIEMADGVVVFVIMLPREMAGTFAARFATPG